MKVKIFILLAFTLLIVPSFARGDVLIPGTKGVGYCSEISNINNYTDYVFLAYPISMSGGYKIISAGDCFSFYKIARPSIYAIKKTDFNEAEISNNFTEQKNYFESNPKIAKSDIQLISYGTVPENDPLQKAVIELRIVSLSGNNLNIQKSTVTYTYTNGTSEVKTFQFQNVMPEPSQKAILPWWFEASWYIIIPLLAIVVIVLILVLRKRK